MLSSLRTLLSVRVIRTFSLRRLSPEDESTSPSKLSVVRSAPEVWGGETGSALEGALSAEAGSGDDAPSLSGGVGRPATAACGAGSEAVVDVDSPA